MLNSHAYFEHGPTSGSVLKSGTTYVFSMVYGAPTARVVSMTAPDTAPGAENGGGGHPPLVSRGAVRISSPGAALFLDGAARPVSHPEMNAGVCAAAKQL